MKDLVPEWFSKKRKMCRDAYDIAYKIHLDYASSVRKGPFVMNTVPFEFDKNGWWFNRCLITKEDSDDSIEIIRNYGNFPFQWVQNKKKNFIVCSEDVHSISIVNLAEMKYHTWIFEDEFWVRSIFVNNSGTKLAVCGGIFGDLDSIRFFDLTDPFQFPLPALGQFSGTLIHPDGRKMYPTYYTGWDKIDNTFLLISEELKTENGKDGLFVTEFSININDGCSTYIKEEFHS